MRDFVFVCLLGALLAQDGTVLSIGKNNYSLYQFYTYYSRRQWDSADSIKRGDVFAEFIRREVCILEAKRIGLSNDLDVAAIIRNRSKQLLVNETYEQLVAVPLIDPDIINETRIMAKSKRLIRHILIGYDGSNLRVRPDRTMDDALSLSLKISEQYSSGESFSLLAEKHSDDPSALENSGLVGWVEWGETVPPFQSVAFRLNKGVLSDPVLTEYGYHLILVERVKPSALAFLSDDEYDAHIINISKGSVRKKLREAAIVYDSLQLDFHGVLFNSEAISNIVQAYRLKQKEASAFSSEAVSPDDLLSSFDNKEVVCVYNGRGFGIKWFINKLNKIPRLRRPVLDTADKMISVFQTIILQDIALVKGYEVGVDKTASFVERKNSMISSLLYDYYLRWLVNGVPVPDSIDVRQHYGVNQNKYMGPEEVVVREIRVDSRALCDSLLLIIKGGVDFVSLAKKYSFVNSGVGGVVGPFSRNMNRTYFDAAKILSMNEISPVLPTTDGAFAIIMLIGGPTKNPSPLNKVYAQIEALLIKELQEDAKKNGVDDLVAKYDIVERWELLE